MKRQVEKTTNRGDLDDEAFDRGLLEFRNTPRAGGLSPAQVLFGHPIRSIIPTHRTAFADTWQQQAARLDRDCTNTARVASSSSARLLPHSVLVIQSFFKTPCLNGGIERVSLLPLVDIGTIMSISQVVVFIGETDDSYSLTNLVQPTPIHYR